MSQTGMEDNLYTADQFIGIFGHVIANALKELKELPPEQKKEKWIQEVEEFYQKAIDLPYIRKPLAWALYQVWKKHDEEDKSRRTNNE